MTRFPGFIGAEQDTRSVWESLSSRTDQLDVILAAILLGPMVVLEVAGRTPALFWVDIVVALLAGIAGLKALLQPNGLRIPNVMLWALLYLSIAFASLTLTIDPLAGIALFKLRIMPMAVFLLAYGLTQDRDDVDHFYVSVILFGGVLAAISLYSWYEFSKGILTLSEDFGPKDMLQSSFGRSNFLASIFIVVIPVCIPYINRSRNRMQPLLVGVALLLMLAALMFTQSRGALISLLVGMIAWVLVALAKSFTIRRVSTAVAIAMGIPLGIALIWPAIPDKVRVGLETAFGALFAQVKEGNYGGDRTDQWVAALKGAWSSHLLGIGLGNQIPFYTRLGLTPSAHSVYLETLLETGLLGLVALLGIFYGFGINLKRIWQACPKQDRLLAGALMASFVTALVNVAQETSFWAAQYSYLFWMMMGVACAWRRMETRRNWSVGAREPSFISGP